MVRRALLFAACAIGSSPVLADGILSLKVENDLLAVGDQDGHYTNGIEGAWTFEPGADHWTRRLSNSIPLWSHGEVDAVTYRVGHQMYTPTNIKRSDLIEDDRPYAGYLYGGISLFQDNASRWLRTTDALHLDIGIVGPAAGAKHLQKVAHNISGSDDPEGWHNQLHNEPTVSLGWSRAWWLRNSLGGLELEYGPNVGFNLGNLYDYASSGIGLRFGHDLEHHYGIPGVAPSQSGRSYFTPNAADFGWFGFVNLEGRYMAHNLFLDGNTFEDSHDVDRREWVGDAQAGVAFNWNRWSLAFTHVWRTHEFEEQDRSDRFGSLVLSTWL
ncbi:lipid A deacylase LpxR family protein [Phytohalomonas tamaricis]|uniref:lipid A deacylase LpxR family protein n=1 Tax=Phytohalomonas tamaricis TaxID=2081032 RepID=UPI000D0B2BFB|nr:lipid A deacylase LpxR family protein [Phytohalomonas tamaricis]